MGSPVRIRVATPADAESVVVAVRRSIVELCAEDHQHDENTLELWLGNKTPERFRTWIANPERYTVVADRGDHVCGVGMVGTDGEIRLLYVHPEHTGAGVGRAILRALEDQARRWGVSVVTLDSTIAAMPFYQAHGFKSTGAPTPGFGITLSRPHAKPLDP